MTNNNLDEIVRRSLAIREKYHALETTHHGSEWTVEEDALAYLTDAGLVGRNIMSQQQRWPKANSQTELEHKLGENIWWLIVLADRTGIDINEALEKFLTKTENLLAG
ncbi:nucleoside triphosphate pyrophosphohydrolase family protein [Mucilaginibacter pedocola]|uniref:30S ribosomal protein S15 n=1 Tax=Mucilaginibacter pedocola TaxID=1792845 RepID=A0A1S9PKS5_9SPHI|nr:30S ribosomal protein S15 [Mucilaginibacter pedocola]OOQ61551.1 30S ribosomal protein S15 [Mucilaginibacter pedocola]